ncbi:MAG: hypothetical protein E6G58_04870 [Actinobacteria bacterium]|nr:MAG: hypothetical protein E6G58_04870 [Actinomycetota bacterium]
MAGGPLRLTRIDLPFLLGTALTSDRKRVKAIGDIAHFLFGFLFSLGYFAILWAVGRSGWLLGAALGLAHGAFAGAASVNVLLPLVHPMGDSMSASDTVAHLERPGFLMLNYGRRKPVVVLVAHIASGAIVGGFIALS